MSKHWYLIQTKPRQEFTARDNVKNQGFEVYLPKFTLDNGDKPLFPGYIFARLADNINWSPLFSTKGIARFVRFGSDFAVVPEGIINLIMKREKDAGISAMQLSSHAVALNNPIKPKKKLIVVVSAIAGFIFGVLWVLIAGVIRGTKD